MSNNQRLKHPTLGNEIVFISHKDDDVLIFHSFLAANNGQTELHYHTKITEQFTILKGELTLTINHKLFVLKQGETITVQPFDRHKLFNNTNETVQFEVIITPVLNIRKGFEIMYGLANDNKVLKTGLPKNIFHSAIAFLYLDAFTPNLPLWLQQFGFKALVSISKGLGIYTKVIDKYTL